MPRARAAWLCSLGLRVIVFRAYGLGLRVMVFWGYGLGLRVVVFRV